MKTHENFVRAEEIQGGSDRSFGIVFAVIFGIVALFPLLDGEKIHLWALFGAAGFAGIALVYPRVLAPANRLWMRFGLLLSKIVNPIVLGILFYGVLAPTGFVLRAMGKDVLKCDIDPGAPSYWIERETPGPSPESMKNQF